MEPGGPSPWQREADLLAEGREYLERVCRSTRYRHLYPEGASLALLLRGYQELDRQRTIGRLRGSRGRYRRRFRRILRRLVRDDALDRSHRLQFRYPMPRARQIFARPEVVSRALHAIDPDTRPLVEARLRGQRAVPDASASIATEAERERRGLAQLRDALINEALADPPAIVHLHPHFVQFAASPPPRRRQRPLLTFLLVKLPLGLVGGLIALLVTMYVGAWAAFNDEVLGDFVSDRVSGLVQGELRMGSIHWDLPLVYDLVVGNPSHVVVEDIDVWEPYESYGGERVRRAAHADRLEVRIVLHEIIPWNRLGIPTALEIPWVLHFTDVQTDESAWFAVRDYEAVNDDGETVRLLGLRDAFVPLEPRYDKRGLSFAVDNARFSRTELDLDFAEAAGWRTQLDFDWVNFSLSFEAPPPETGVPVELPLRFAVEAQGRRGALAIDDTEVPLADVRVRRFDAGTRGTPLADIGFEGRADAAGSLVDVSGLLGDALARPLVPGAEPLPASAKGDYAGAMTVSLAAATDDAGGIVDHLLSEFDLPPETVDAHARPLTASIEGPVSDPRYRLDSEGLTLDLLDEPAWALDDVRVSAAIDETTVPGRWPFEGDAPRRRVVRFDVFEGAGLNGTFHLHEDSVSHIVMPQLDDEPWRIAMDVEIDGVDPSMLMPDDPDTAGVLAGTASGRIDMRRLELGPPTLPSDEPDATVLRYAELELFDGVLERDRGPHTDGIPKRIAAHGVVKIDEAGGIDLDGLRLSTDGAYLDVDGGVTDDMTKLRETLLRLRIDRGAAFSRAFAIDRYFDTLRADITMFGSTGAPSSKPGSVRVTGFGDGPPTDATIRFDKGTLIVHTDRAHLFGGAGPVDAKVVLFSGGEPAREPRVSGSARLEGIKLEELVSEPGLSGRADVELTVDDGQGHPAPLSALVVTGTAKVPRLRYADTVYRDAEIEFRVDPKTLKIRRLSLPIHRRVSPLHGPGVTVPIGEIVASGEVGLRGDPSLDLEVEMRGVPTRLVTNLLGVETPVRGQIAEGTHLTVGGTLRRPSIEGNVELVGVSAEGLALGSGGFEVTSADAPRDGPLAAHREVRARGELATRDDGTPKLQWTVDAVVAIGSGSREPPVDAELDIAFDRLSVGTLLARSDASGRITGELEGLGAHVVTCNDAAPMLSACVKPADERPALAIDLRLEQAWVSGAGLDETTKRPCAEPNTLCSAGPLEARLDWPVLTLARPWPLSMGEGRDGNLTVTGGLDLGSDPPEGGGKARPPPPSAGCRPPALTTAAPRHATAGPQAEIRGVVDLAVVAPLVADLGVEIEKGQLDVDLTVGNRLGDPRVSGRVTLAERSAEAGPPGVVIRVPGIKLPIELRDLDLRVVGDWLAAAGTVHASGRDLEFGTVRGERTGYAFAGPCNGSYAVAAEGAVSAAMINAVAGSAIAPRGSVDVARAVVAGHTEHGLARADASLNFASEPLFLDLTEGLDEFRISDGRVDVSRCQGEVCPGIADGAIAVFFGGDTRTTSTTPSSTRPADALQARVGNKGRGFAWGTAYLAADFTHFVGSDVHVDLRDVPYHDYDVRGRPVYEVEVSGDNIRLRGGDPLVVSGDIDLDRSRYVKDAIEGVNLLAFTESIDVPEAPPPEIMRTVQFDLRAETESLARIDNNVAERVEADLVVDLTGTYENPEFTGRVEIEPGGIVDIPFVTGTYEIQRGRISLVGEIEHAEVDILALRNEPVYIDGTPRRISLLLGGTVSAITWNCIVQGDTSRVTSTQRGCLDYLVLGAGDVAVSDLDVRRSGGGGLTNARKPLQVVGHVTEFDFSERIEAAAPRYRTYVPDVKARLGQIGPELEVATPVEWMDFDYGHARAGWHYTRGYPGFLLRQSREFNYRIEILDPITIEYSRDIRDYLNERIIFDPLEQRTLELRLDFEIPSLR